MTPAPALDLTTSLRGDFFAVVGPKGQNSLKMGGKRLLKDPKSSGKKCGENCLLNESVHCLRAVRTRCGSEDCLHKKRVVPELATPCLMNCASSNFRG